MDKAFTIAWWDRLIADEEAMVRWLQKLQHTEYEGWTGNIENNARWNTEPKDLKIEQVLLKTGDDELRHSDMLVELLNKRGVGPSIVSPPSLYWEEMEKHVVDLKTCSAMCYLGEQLAADRFQIILEHPGTPSDVLDFIKSALPDEKYHARIFRILAGDEAIAKMALIQENVLAMMRKAA